jgi:prepilin-type N-terminal cleavage/methylation domain-containing protein
LVNQTRSGFTLLEAAVTLAIAGMVLLSFQGLVQVVKTPETDVQLQFLQTTDALMRQDPSYQLQRVEQDAVFMRRQTSSGYTDYRLEVHNNYLRFGIVGKSGQIILMRDVETMQAQSIRHGFKLTIQTTKGEVYSSEIVLPSDPTDTDIGAEK